MKKIFMPIYSLIGLLGVLGTVFLADISFHEVLCRQSLVANILAGIVASILIVLVCQVGSRFKIVQDLEKVLKEFVDEFSWTDIPLAAMFSAVCEELFFRLFLLNILGLVASSLVFGILHFPIKKELQLWTVFAFIMGFILGAFYIYFGLISAITLHFCVNLVNLIRLKQR